jgi:hypothetical protein
MNNYCTHCFSVELATKIGMREAIILQHLYWWHQHNADIPAMNIDGRVWFFLSTAKIAEVFPYLSEKVVRTILEKLIKDGYLVKDHKGEGPQRFNRTNWYALTNSALGFFHLPIWENGEPGMGKSIVNNNSYNTSPNGESNNISISPKPQKFDFRKALLSAGVEPEVADAWMQVRKAKKAVNTEIAWKAISNQIARAEKIGKTANECIRVAVEKSWSGFNADWLEDFPSKGTPSRRAGAPVRRNNTEDLLALGAEMFGPQPTPYDEQ